MYEKYSFRNFKQPMIKEQPGLPFKNIGCDILGYKSHFNVIFEDYYIKWTDIIKLKANNSENIIKVLAK